MTHPHAGPPLLLLLLALCATGTHALNWNTLPLNTAGGFSADTSGSERGGPD